MIILFDGDIRNDGFGVLKKRNRLRAIVLIWNVRRFILEIILLSSFPEKVCWGKNLHTVCKGISYTGCPKQKLTNRTKSKQKLSALGPNYPMNMTWGRLILLSLSKKQPKNTSQAQVVPITGDWACTPWLQRILLVPFFGTPCLRTRNTRCIVTKI